MLNEVNNCGVAKVLNIVRKEGICRKSARKEGTRNGGGKN